MHSPLWKHVPIEEERRPKAYKALEDDIAKKEKERGAIDPLDPLADQERLRTLACEIAVHKRNLAAFRTATQQAAEMQKSLLKARASLIKANRTFAAAQINKCWIETQIDVYEKTISELLTLIKSDMDAPGLGTADMERTHVSDSDMSEADEEEAAEAAPTPGGGSSDSAALLKQLQDQIMESERRTTRKMEAERIESERRTKAAMDATSQANTAAMNAITQQLAAMHTAFTTQTAQHAPIQAPLPPGPPQPPTIAADGPPATPHTENATPAAATAEAAGPAAATMDTGPSDLLQQRKAEQAARDAERATSEAATAAEASEHAQNGAKKPTAFWIGEEDPEEVASQGTIPDTQRRIREKGQDKKEKKEKKDKTPRRSTSQKRKEESPPAMTGSTVADMKRVFEGPRAAKLPKHDPFGPEAFTLPTNLGQGSGSSGDSPTRVVQM